MSSGTLLIFRPRHYADMMRRYQIIVDGRELGSLAAGDELRLELPEGEHQVVARIDWARSNYLLIGIRDGAVTELEVGANASGWLVVAVLYFATVGFRRYLYLRHRSSGFPVAPP